MLSPFLKKLLFVRKFFMMDGQIEILGQKQVLLPFSALVNLKSEQMFTVMKEEMKKVMENYAKIMGTSSGGMINSVKDIYETMGLGKMTIISLDADKKKTVLRIEKVGSPNPDLVRGVLGGLFSTVFNREISSKDVIITQKIGYVDVSIQ